MNTKGWRDSLSEPLEFTHCDNFYRSQLFWSKFIVNKYFL